MTSKRYKRKPRVVIAGRPNVGKSTLFNRLIRKRRAITDPTPGVTRDPLEHPCSLEGHDFILVDTGGYKLDQDEMDALVADKALEEMARADVILFLMDVADVTPEDEAFIERLRRWEEKLVVVANKVDSSDRESLVYDLYQYGFADIIGISAAHNGNIHEFSQLLLKRIKGVEARIEAETRNRAGAETLLEDSEEGEAGEEDRPLRLLILGKPNAGKSTLTNRLIGGELSLVSPIPGTTRDTVDGLFSYKGRKFQVTDTAGIRRKKKVSENVEYYSVNRAIASIKEADEVILLVDAKEGLTDQDKKITSQIVKHGKGVVIAVNKWDLMEDMANQKQAFRDRIRYVFPALGFAPIVMISAHEGQGMKELLNQVLAQWHQANTKISTSELNDALRDWVDFTPPPLVKGKSLKLFYMTQTGTAPASFVLFASHKKAFPPSYHQYIVNNIRKEFKMDLIPLRVELKERSRGEPRQGKRSSF